MNAPSSPSPFTFSEAPLDTAALQRGLRDDTCGGFAAFEGVVGQQGPAAEIRHRQIRYEVDDGDRKTRPQDVDGRPQWLCRR